MAVIIDRYKLFYVAVPKAACTSLKHFFFEIENGFPFRRFTANGRYKGIHDVAYGTGSRHHYSEDRVAGYHKFAVIRDPIRRFLSAYSNKILDKGMLSLESAGDQLNKLQLPPNPSLDVFIELLEEYEKGFDMVRHHIQPMVKYLGNDPEYFTRVFRIDQLDELEVEVERIVGSATPKILRENRSGQKIPVETLNRQQITKIISYYAEDYEVFGHLLSKRGSKV